MLIELYKKIKQKEANIITIYLILNITWIFLGTILYSYFKFPYRNYSTSYIVLLITNIIISIIFIKKEKPKLIDILLILLIIFGLLATIFSQNISISLYGYWRRYEGMLQLFYYYSLLYLSSKINNKYVIYSILTFGIMNAFISYLQVFNILKFIPVNFRGTHLGQGLLTNSNFLGSYMNICLGISIGLFIKDDKKNIPFLILTIIYYISLLISNALSGMIGLFMILIFVYIIFIYKIKTKKIKKIDIIKHIVLIICIATTTIILNQDKQTVIIKDIKNMSYETKEIIKGNISESYGTSRFYIWNNSLKNLKHNLLHGAGIDCFVFAFKDGTLVKEMNGQLTYFDKAHNEYLQKLMCEGIFSCITYIVLLFTIFINALKNIFKQKNYKVIPLFLAFIGYITQAFFNISVLEVAPLFFIVSGLLYNRNLKNG